MKGRLPDPESLQELPDVLGGGVRLILLHGEDNKEEQQEEGLVCVACEPEKIGQWAGKAMGHDRDAHRGTRAGSHLTLVRDLRSIPYDLVSRAHRHTELTHAHYMNTGSPAGTLVHPN